MCARDPHVSPADIFLHLGALYVITSGEWGLKVGKALAPASPAASGRAIQPRLFRPDYQHLFPNLIRRVLC